MGERSADHAGLAADELAHSVIEMGDANKPFSGSGVDLLRRCGAMAGAYPHATRR